MPDPRRDLAPIIEPPPPPAEPAGPDLALPMALGLAGVALMGALLWWWRRRAPLRALRRIATRADARAGADQLARLVTPTHVGRPFGRLIKPVGLKADPQTADRWQAELDRLRFGRPTPEDAATLARLCREAEVFCR